MSCQNVVSLNFEDQCHFRGHHRHVSKLFEQRCDLGDPRSHALEGRIDAKEGEFGPEDDKIKLFGGEVVINDG